MLDISRNRVLIYAIFIFTKRSSINVDVLKIRFETHVTFRVCSNFFDRPSWARSSARLFRNNCEVLIGAGLAIDFPRFSTSRVIITSGVTARNHRMREAARRKTHTSALNLCPSYQQVSLLRPPGKVAERLEALLACDACNFSWNYSTYANGSL